MSNMVVSLLLKIREEGSGAIGKLRDQLKAVGNDSSLGEAIGNVIHDNFKEAVSDAKELGASLKEAGEQGHKLVEKVLHGTLGLGAALYAFKKGFLDIAEANEKMQTRLQGIEGTKGRAVAALATLREWRDETNTTTEDMVGAWIELREHGIRPLHSTMTSLADTAASSGKTVTEVAREFSNVISDHSIGRMRALGVEMVNQGDRIGVRYNYLGKTITETFAKANRTVLANGLSTILDKLHGGTAKEDSEGLGGSLKKLHAGWEDFALAVMDKGGVLKYLTEQLKDYATGGKETADGMKDNAQSLADVFKTIIKYGFKAVIYLREHLPEAIVWVRKFVASVGGMERVLIAVAAVMVGPFALAMLAVVAPLFWLMASCAAFLAGLLAGLVTVIVTTVIPAIWGFTAALLANPITWIVIAILALIAVAWLLYENWDQVSAYLQDLWNDLSTEFSEAGDEIAAIWEDLWNGISQLFEDAWNSIKADASKTADDFMKEWEPVKAFFVELWGYIKTGWDNSIGLIGAGIDKVRGFLPSFGGNNPAAAGAGGSTAGSAIGAGVARVDGTLKVDIKIDNDGRATGRVREAGASGGLEINPSLGLGFP
jgi:hypothetical protein